MKKLKSLTSEEMMVLVLKAQTNHFIMYPYGEGIKDAKQKLMYDMYHIKHWTIWFEIKIIYK